MFRCYEFPLFCIASCVIRGMRLNLPSCQLITLRRDETLTIGQSPLRSILSSTPNWSLLVEIIVFCRSKIILLFTLRRLPRLYSRNVANRIFEDFNFSDTAIGKRIQNKYQTTAAGLERGAKRFVPIYLGPEKARALDQTTKRSTAASRARTLQLSSHSSATLKRANKAL